MPFTSFKRAGSRSSGRKELRFRAASITGNLIRNFVHDFLSDLLKEDIHHSRLYSVDKALLLIVRNISSGIHDGAETAEIKIEATMTHSFISFRAFDPGEGFDPRKPPFFKDLDDTRYRLMKHSFNHIRYSRTNGMNCSEFIVRL